MEDPSIRETLPPELIQEVISALHRFPRDPAVKGTFNNAMQTCRAMRLICSGFITRLAVEEFDALASFPRHAVVKRLDLFLYSETLIWLTGINAAARERLKYVEIVEVEVDDELEVR